MDYVLSDSSGTDDDLPPHQNRVPRAVRLTGNGRSAVGSGPFSRSHIEMDTQIHHLEQEAYCAVLRAFKAQSDALSWEKEGLITELRKELRVSDEEHRELLGRVNADEVIMRIREWRKSGGHQVGALHSPIVSASRKKQKTSHPLPSLSLNPQNVAASMQPSLSSAKRGAAVGARGKQPKSGSKSAQYPSSGLTSDPYIGRKVMIRWPADNNFYEAVITDYDPVKGLHAFVYDICTENESLEWVNIKELSDEDIRWVTEDIGISRPGGRGGIGRGPRRSMTRDGSVPGAGVVRETIRDQHKNDLLPSQNSTGKKNLDDIEMLPTDTVVKKVEMVFESSHPDLQEIEQAKKMLKEHEQTLIDAIARLADASDGESVISSIGKQAVG